MVTVKIAAFQTFEVFYGASRMFSKISTFKIEVSIVNLSQNVFVYSLGQF